MYVLNMYSVNEFWRLALAYTNSTSLYKIVDMQNSGKVLTRPRVVVHILGHFNLRSGRLVDLMSTKLLNIIISYIVICSLISQLEKRKENNLTFLVCYVVFKYNY